MRILKKYATDRAVAIMKIKEIKSNDKAINLVVSWDKFDATTGETKETNEKVVIFKNGTNNTAERFEKANIEAGTIICGLVKLSDKEDEAHILNGFILPRNKFDLTVPSNGEYKEYKFSVIFGKPCKVKESEDKNMLYVTVPCFIKNRGIEFIDIKVSNADFNNNLKDRAAKCIYKNNTYAFIVSDIVCTETDLPKKDKDGIPVMDETGNPVKINNYSCYLNGFVSAR